MGSVKDDYLLLLGSNHRRAIGFRLALRRLSEQFELLACSGIRRTLDGAGPHYLNAALRVGVGADWDVARLRQALRMIEAEAGRVRGGAVCALDIDLAAKYDGQALAEIYKPDDLRRDYIQPLLWALDLHGLPSPRSPRLVGATQVAMLAGRSAVVSRDLRRSHKRENA
jgi:7,8-dihydro-6-hydroxymethylpterin-pyrophosphokinase